MLQSLQVQRHSTEARLVVPVRQDRPTAHILYLSLQETTALTVISNFVHHGINFVPSTLLSEIKTEESY